MLNNSVLPYWNAKPNQPGALYILPYHHVKSQPNLCNNQYSPLQSLMVFSETALKAKTHPAIARYCWFFLSIRIHHRVYSRNMCHTKNYFFIQVSEQNSCKQIMQDSPCPHWYVWAELRRESWKQRRFIFPLPLQISVPGRPHDSHSHI